MHDKYWIFQYYKTFFKNNYFFSIILKKNFFNLNNFFKIIKKFEFIFYFKKIINTNNQFIQFKNKFKMWNFFNINFLKKEKIYTKLKYSRVPQYDIVSGGIAALFSGFLGFLICEKFGFELIDSGDFYILFMYIVFLSFFLKLLSKLFNNNNFFWSFLSFNWFMTFYRFFFFFLLNLILNNYKKII